MYIVKQWRDIGVEFVEGDQISGEHVTRKGAEAVNKGGFSGNREATGFTPRKNTGTQPVPNGVVVDLTFKDASIRYSELPQCFAWNIKRDFPSSEIEAWKPSLTQPLIDKQKESEMSESEIHKAWVALNGDLANARGFERGDNVVVICLSKVGVFNVGNYSTSEWYAGASNKHWKVICTIQEFTDYCEMMKEKRPSEKMKAALKEADEFEKRMDIIGQNGNDGLHYDNTAQHDKFMSILACAMKSEIDSNSAKGDFFSWSPSSDELVSEINHHVAKLNNAIYSGLSTHEYAADVANYMLKCVQMDCNMHDKNTAQQFESLASDSKPVFAQAMADKGELPPVGSESILNVSEFAICADWLKEINGNKVTTIAHIDGLAVCTPSDSIYRDMYGAIMFAALNNQQFKPIQSPRDKAIDEVKAEWPIPCKGTITVMIDMGYRKLTPEHAKMYDDKTSFFGEDY